MIETIHANNYNIEELLYEYDDNDTKEQEQKKEKKLFLFLEADYFENVKEEVEEMDINANTLQLWEHSSLWHEYKDNGPLIVETANNSPIFKKFVGEWSEENRGVMLLSDYSLKEVTGHLQSLIFVTEPNLTLTRLRLYEPRKLRGVLNAMQEPNALSDLMGCIEQFIWQENCGLDEEWLVTQNPNPHAPRYNIHDENWFRFTQEQNVILEEHEEWFFCKRLSLELEDSFNVPLSTEEALTVMLKLNEEAKTFNFFQNSDKEVYMKLRLVFGDFRTHKEIKNILDDNNYKIGGKIMCIKNYLNQNKGAING